MQIDELPAGEQTRQFIYLHGYISFLCFLFVEYK